VGTGSVVGGIGVGSTGGHSGPGPGISATGTVSRKMKKEAGLTDIVLSLGR